MTESYRLKKIANLVSDKNTVLDLGCSSLPNPFFNNENVIGIDLVPTDLPDNYASFKQCDVMSLSESFINMKVDAITAGELIEHLEEPVRFLKECYETLEDGGILVLSTPNPNSFAERLLTLNLSSRFFYTKEHIMLYPQRWLIRIMNIAGFGNVKLYSGGMFFPFISTIPFPRPWCYQTIAAGVKKKNS
ncbi:MAG: methyltransferase domain-containing protein [Candidatus Delongbacteria bacterium]|jgi:2-polyprenyl-3-methyl-5-hydroxy-6-metoxy-1,4-benzoquinol methylase|nr:methyltransferase domain-containing protein [Candidatus Delongbacteria bacterium]MDY0016711.1 methyltransferase domain-containing protein [Candidatus Delongbacteria bacterium]